MTVANLFTSIRIILTPIFLIYVINDQVFLAFFVFVLAGLTDALDGIIARLCNQKSKVGAILDPLADKLLVITAYVTIPIKRHTIPAWLSAIVISRDVLILLGVLILFLNSIKFEIKPSCVSKITTCFQISTVLSALLSERFLFFKELNSYLHVLTAVFTISSGLHYMGYWFRLISENNNTKKIN
jgi:cardiolipin synthase